MHINSRKLGPSSAVRGVGKLIQRSSGERGFERGGEGEGGHGAVSSRRRASKN